LLALKGLNTRGKAKRVRYVTVKLTSVKPWVAVE
jgi:hypothetical protein